MSIRCFHRYVMSLLAVAVILIPFQRTATQWKMTNGPYGGMVDVLSLASSGTHLWMGSPSNVATSDDYGEHWRLIDSLGTENRVSVWGEDIYVGNFSGLWRSGDGGHTWKNIYSTTSAYPFGSVVLMESTIFVRKEDGGIFRITDPDTAWTWVGAGLPAVAHVNAMVPWDSLKFVSTSEGVFVSSDHGIWSNSLSWDEPLVSQLIVGRNIRPIMTSLTLVM